MTPDAALTGLVPIVLLLTGGPDAGAYNLR
jgi:hypothetical protein